MHSFPQTLVLRLCQSVSLAMIAEGCIMARVCHTNNCPVGVASQKEALRKRFTGIPEHVVNFFLFGKTAEEISTLQQEGYRPWELISSMPELGDVLRLIEQGHFSNGDGDLFRPLLQNLTGRDPFFVLADFNDYLRAQGEVDRAWADRGRWNRMSLLNSARSGFFSSDRSIREYAERIWQADSYPVTITCETE